MSETQPIRVTVATDFDNDGCGLTPRQIDYFKQLQSEGSPIPV